MNEITHELGTGTLHLFSVAAICDVGAFTHTNALSVLARSSAEAIGMGTEWAKVNFPTGHNHRATAFLVSENHIKRAYAHILARQLQEK